MVLVNPPWVHPWVQYRASSVLAIWPNNPFNAGSTIILVNGFRSASHPTWQVQPSPSETTLTSRVNLTGVGASVARVKTCPSVAPTPEVRTRQTDTPPVTLKEQRSPSDVKSDTGPDESNSPNVVQFWKSRATCVAELVNETAGDSIRVMRFGVPHSTPRGRWTTLPKVQIDPR